MSVYACSDIHGQKRLYDQMMEQIGSDDTLYIVGDAIDRGPDSIGILRDIMDRDNVHLLLGNHEFLMINALTDIGVIDRFSEDIPTINSIDLWRHDDFHLWICPANGGRITYQALRKLPGDERELILEYIQNTHIQKIVEAGDQKFCLVHSHHWYDKSQSAGTGSSADHSKHPEKQTDDRILYDIKYDKNTMRKPSVPDCSSPYEKLFSSVWDSPFRDDTWVPPGEYHAFSDHTFIIGHVPVQRLGESMPLRDGNIIDIDCGCALLRHTGGRTGNLCLLNLDILADSGDLSAAVQLFGPQQSGRRSRLLREGEEYRAGLDSIRRSYETNTAHF